MEKTSETLPFGRKPPGPAQVVPAPPRLVQLASDSVRPEGERVRAYHGGYALELPILLLEGVAFDVSAQFPGPVEGALVRFFIDGAAHADASTVAGLARASLRIDTPGEHRVRVQFLGAAGYAPAEILHVVRVETAPGAP